MSKILVNDRGSPFIYFTPPHWAYKRDSRQGFRVLTGCVIAFLIGYVKFEQLSSQGKMEESPQLVDIMKKVIKRYRMSSKPTA